MSNGVEKLNIRFRFKGDVSEEQEQEMWAQFFDAIGLFEDENVRTSEMPRIAAKKCRTHQLSSSRRKTRIVR